MVLSRTGKSDGKHLDKVKEKLERRRLALTVLAASTWGCPLREARLLYTQVIRSTMIYGAGIWHTPAKRGGVVRGVAKVFVTEQSKCLRVVTGAYRATPLIDLYLDHLQRRFHDRIASNGTGEKIRQACATVANHIRRRQCRNTAPRPWFEPFAGRPFPEPGGLQPKEILERDWKEQWGRTEQQQHSGGRTANPPRPKSRQSSILLRKWYGSIALHMSLLVRESTTFITCC